MCGLWTDELDFRGTLTVGTTLHTKLLLMYMYLEEDLVSPH